ncbi:MAG: 50S ribosomal protein L18 [Phycisphaeraceae bacterium]
METNKLKRLRRSRRKTGLRKRIVGTPAQPRLSVFRSNKHMYAQVIDDLAGHTLAAASTVQEGMQDGGDVDSAKQVGQKLAEKAKAAGIEKVTFDRNGFRYHGRVKALADAAREGGLQF